MKIPWRLIFFNISFRYQTSNITYRNDNLNFEYIVLKTKSRGKSLSGILFFYTVRFLKFFDFFYRQARRPGDY